MSKRFYNFVLYDDDRMLYDYISIVSDDSNLTECVSKVQEKGRKIHCSTMYYDSLSDIELERSAESLGYEYRKGLFDELGIE